jgi:hypothetical protein
MQLKLQPSIIRSFDAGSEVLTFVSVDFSDNRHVKVTGELARLINACLSSHDSVESIITLDGLSSEDQQHFYECIDDLVKAKILEKT